MSCAVFWRARRASLIRDLLSNIPNCYVRGGELREYIFTGECVTAVCEAERNWHGKSS